MINLNGNLVEDQNAKLSVFNRGLAYGDSVFETIRVINGQVMFWEDHYFRLMASMRIMRMEIPASFSPEFLEEKMGELVEANDLKNSPARIRFTVFRKEGGYYTPATREIDYIITVAPLKDAFYLLNEEDYEIELFKDHYITSGLLATIKSNNRAVNVLGSIYASENNYENCLLLNEKKSVVEALNGNLFVVKGNTIKTPPLTDGALNGITRKKLLEVIKDLPEYTLEEASVSPFELQKADELFITNVVLGIQPITKYRKKNFDNTVARDLLSKLNVKARLG
ncbi:MAG: aminotransferase class IV [Salegentibacter sp.]|uniref:Branched-chain amino acid aminotransferase n=1 Tax=Salegentibacter flavus TaxID=287099 RepID=A0A1I4YGL5_9FLAO|nr:MULTISPECIES: aminotransferase class IV [Salegentibacter]MDR9456145.1 aminotransferase class IV [Salegentibacter sp.]SFN37184.1 branched-chain amino acid aminotransferase [Salegentibacter flavus]